MDAAALAALVSMMQDHVQEAADALKKLVNDNLSPESTPAAVDLNMALLEVDAIAADLGQLVFQVEDALRGSDVSMLADLPVSSSLAAEEDAWPSRNNDGDDILLSEWSTYEVFCSSTEEAVSVESDRSWRL